MIHFSKVLWFESHDSSFEDIFHCNASMDASLFNILAKQGVASLLIVRGLVTLDHVLSLKTHSLAQFTGSKSIGNLD
jgi:hypothetical protein